MVAQDGQVLMAGLLQLLFAVQELLLKRRVLHHVDALDGGGRRSRPPEVVGFRNTRLQGQVVLGEDPRGDDCLEGEGEDCAVGLLLWQGGKDVGEDDGAVVDRTVAQLLGALWVEEVAAGRGCHRDDLRGGGSQPIRSCLRWSRWGDGGWRSWQAADVAEGADVFLVEVTTLPIHLHPP